MKLLIVFGTTEGQTLKICEFLRDEALKNQHKVVLHDAGSGELFPDGFDAVIIASSLHAQHYHDDVISYVKEHADALNKLPSNFISVSLTAAGDDAEKLKELESITANFLHDTGWQPDYVDQVAGALRYTKYNFLKKIIMRMIAQRSGGDTDTSKDHEYTDWEHVRRILHKLERVVEEETTNA
jgi:menaquinone-dependent protoporphyrinogen oxidase